MLFVHEFPHGKFLQPQPFIVLFLASLSKENTQSLPLVSLNNPNELVNYPKVLPFQNNITVNQGKFDRVIKDFIDNNLIFIM